MYSVTGNILTGTQRRPDIFTLHTRSRDESDGSTDTISSFPENHEGLRLCGYVPVLSTFTGMCRSLIGLIHTIVHVACAIFDAKNRAEHLEEAKLGGINFGRGLVEMIPLVGNYAMIMTDVERSKKFMKEGDRLIKNDPSYTGYTALFGNGREIERRLSETLDKDDKRFQHTLKGQRRSTID